MEGEGHTFTCSETHWSTLDTMKEYVNDILAPYFMKEKAAMKDHIGENWENFPCVGILDCWKVPYVRI
jgi:hypothetical protein